MKWLNRQPAACKEPDAMDGHKFLVGEAVQLAPHITDRNMPGGMYEISRQLPERAGEYQYGIKSFKEPYERLVNESDLRKL